MARVIVTAPADADIADILTEIASEAGYIVADTYNTRIERLYERLTDYPERCRARAELGLNIRVGVVAPYLVIYQYNVDSQTVSIIRILHGRRRITRKLLRGD